MHGLFSLGDLAGRRILGGADRKVWGCRFTDRELDNDDMKRTKTAASRKPSTGIGPPLRWLNRTAREEWRYIVRAGRPGTFTRTDGHIVALTATLGARIRLGTAKKAEMKLYRSLLREYRIPLAKRRQMYSRLGI
jgi:hypothetical protein